MIALQEMDGPGTAAIAEALGLRLRLLPGLPPSQDGPRLRQRHPVSLAHRGEPQGPAPGRSRGSHQARAAVTASVRVGTPHHHRLFRPPDLALGHGRGGRGRQVDAILADADGQSPVPSSSPATSTATASASASPRAAFAGRRGRSGTPSAPSPTITSSCAAGRPKACCTARDRQGRPAGQRSLAGVGGAPGLLPRDPVDGQVEARLRVALVDVRERAASEYRLSRKKTVPSAPMPKLPLMGRVKRRPAIWM